MRSGGGGRASLIWSTAYRSRVCVYRGSDSSAAWDFLERLRRAGRSNRGGDVTSGFMIRSIHFDFASSPHPWPVLCVAWISNYHQSTLRGMIGNVGENGVGAEA